MKKHKKTGQGEIRCFGYSHPFFLFARRKTFWVLAVGMIVCAAIASYFCWKYLYNPEVERQRKGQPTDQIEGRVLLPVYKPLRSEQEINTLKKEELELAEKLMRDFPGDVDTLIIMGNVWNRHGNAIEALKWWKEALKVNPKRGDVYAMMGWLSIRKGEFEEAIVHYRKALDIQPQISDAHSNIAHALMILGRQDEAIEELRKEIQISPDSSFAYSLIGQAYLQQKQYEKAKESYEAAIKNNPEYSNAYYGLATVYTKLGHSDKAKVYLEKLQKLKAQERKDLKGRKIKYDDFVETQKNSALTFIELGRIYLDKGNLQRAEELLKRAAGLDPENADCFQELVSLYKKTGEPSKALQMYKKISEIEPNNSICFINIGIFSVQLKQFDDAENAFRKAIVLAPKRSEGYCYLARLYLTTNSRIAEARQLAEKAVALEASAPNYFVLSWACAKSGYTADALSAIKRAIELEPGNNEYLKLYKLIQNM